MNKDKWYFQIIATVIGKMASRPCKDQTMGDTLRHHVMNLFDCSVEQADFLCRKNGFDPELKTRKVWSDR